MKSCCMSSTISSNGGLTWQQVVRVWPWLSSTPTLGSPSSSQGMIVIPSSSIALHWDGVVWLRTDRVLSRTMSCEACSYMCSKSESPDFLTYTDLSATCPWVGAHLWDDIICIIRVPKIALWRFLSICRQVSTVKKITSTGVRSCKTENIRNP